MGFFAGKLRVALVIASVLGSIASSLAADEAKYDSSNSTQALEELWIQGDSNITLSVGGKEVGKLPQRLVVSYEKGDEIENRGKATGKFMPGKIRLGYAYSSSDFDKVPATPEDIGPNEAKAIRGQVTSWLDVGEPMGVVPVQFTIGSRDVHAHIVAFRQSQKFPKSRRDVLTVSSDVLGSPKYIDTLRLYTSPNDEPVLDVVPGDYSRSKMTLNLPVNLCNGARQLPRPNDPATELSFTIHAFDMSCEYEFFVLRPQDEEFWQRTVFPVNVTQDDMTEVYNSGPVTYFFKDTKGCYVAALKIFRS